MKIDLMELYETNAREYDNRVRSYLRDADEYLIIRHRSTWDNSSRYCVTPRNWLTENIVPNEECAIYFVENTKMKKRATFDVHTHDKPLGFNCYVIALSKRDADYIKHNTYTDVMNYIQKYL